MGDLDQATSPLLTLSLSLDDNKLPARWSVEDHTTFTYRLELPFKMEKLWGDLRGSYSLSNVTERMRPIVSHGTGKMVIL